MSEEKDNSPIEIGYLILGITLIFLTFQALIFWRDNNDLWYANNPDFVPGTFLLFGLMFGIPLLVLGFYYGVIGLNELYLYFRSFAATSEDVTIH